MTAKGAFLGRLRDAVGAGAPAPRRPLVPVTDPPEVVPVWPDPELGAIERWVAAFERLGGHVHRTSAIDLAGAIDTAVAGRGPVLVDGRLVRRIAGESPDERAWMEWPSCGLDAAASAFVGIVDATAGIAATGSVVVDTDRNGRLVSLLPRVAVFVLRAADIVLTTGEVLRTHATRWPGGPPTNVVLVTGPSRSGDIEMRLVVGVHGPGEVHAVLVDD